MQPNDTFIVDQEEDDAPKTGKIVLGIDDLVHSLPPDPNLMGKDPMFTAHRSEYGRACAGDKLEGIELARVLGYWKLISALAVHGPDMEQDFQDSIAAFRQTYPRARNAALVIERVWGQAMAAHTIKDLHAYLVAKGRIVVSDREEDKHYLAS